MDTERERPDDGERGELRLLARSLSQVLREMHLLVQVEDGEPLLARLREHLGVDPRNLPVLSHEFPPYQLVDVQVALEAWPEAKEDRTSDVIGVTGDQRRFKPLSELLSGQYGVSIGPVEYVDRADSPSSTRRCVHFGVFLLNDGAYPSAVLMRGEDPHGPMQNAMIEVIDADPDRAKATVTELRRLAVDRSVLRGHVLAMGAGEGQRYGQLRFMRRPHLSREELILPDITLAQIEGHVMGVAAHASRLRAAGQHLRRGVLLYGAPGTGKTHTVRYLLSQLEGVTSFVLSGEALSLISHACGLARVLQPSIVILEDVDLIAGDRGFSPMGGNPLLFEVLNQIDGLGDDVDVTFLLTTNRVDILERALAERPGRVDVAVEIAAPDREGRERLLRLYGDRLGVDDLPNGALDEAIDATEGRTATYLREVVRRAALRVAIDRPDDILFVSGNDLAAAAQALLEDREALTRALLGSAAEPYATSSSSTPPSGAPDLHGWRPGAPGRWTIRGSAMRTSDNVTPFAPGQDGET